MSGPVACPVNIGPRGRRRRLLAGTGVIILTFAAAAGLVLGHVEPKALRLALWLPLFLGLLAVLQARAGL